MRVNMNMMRTADGEQVAEFMRAAVNAFKEVVNLQLAQACFRLSGGAAVYRGQAELVKLTLKLISNECAHPGFLPVIA